MTSIWQCLEITRNKPQKSAKMMNPEKSKSEALTPNFIRKNTNFLSATKGPSMNTNETTSGLTHKHRSAREEENPYYPTGKRLSMYSNMNVVKPKKSAAIFDMKQIEEAK